MIKEFERAVVVVDLPDDGIMTGDVGTVVDITTDGQGVTLEFFNFAGKTVAVVPMSIHEVRPVGINDRMQARAAQTA